MSYIKSVATVDFPTKVDQQGVKEHVFKELFSKFPVIEQAIDIFDNSEIKSRNLCKPLSYYTMENSFQQKNREYVNIVVENAALAISESMQAENIKADEFTDILFISSTGLATPSIDALIVNKLQLNPHINRYPIWGMGCGGGVSGVAKADRIAQANPDAIVLLVAAEMCSLTFLNHDFSKSNFVASSLFSDGIAICIIRGENKKENAKIRIVDAASTFFYDTTDIMGWEFLDSGFQVVFSRDIPAFITKNVKREILSFLDNNGLQLTDIENYIFHPGGKKVLDAYSAALSIDEEKLSNSRAIITQYGNMSSPTVLYVLEKFMREGCQHGYGLMLAMGPGFCIEMVLLKMTKE